MSTIEQQITGLIRNIHKNEAELRSMRARWRELDAPCCPGCMFGQRYTDAYESLERRREWLHILEAKLQRARHPYSPLRCPYYSNEI